ncbi:hypothetical protein A0U92_13465 [Acetobacter aceti]|uniref:Uncharacterized protein n=1 Tax=Acetobacter aceti TaxID=435 RepID=A0A1U9KIJ8_ACEAC|nr:hypothetical protein A0U92_13465 [Acetobacter aceti]
MGVQESSGGLTEAAGLLSTAVRCKPGSALRKIRDDQEWTAFTERPREIPAAFIMRVRMLFACTITGCAFNAHETGLNFEIQ